jgi:hypothetical protein
VTLTASTSDDDLRALAEAGATLGASPFDLLQIFFTESGFDPKALNSMGCVGVNQFCPGTFGKAVPGLSQTGYRNLSAGDQLRRYVVPFLSQKPPSAMRSARDLYWVNWRPATFLAGAPDSHVIFAPASGDLGLDAGLGHGKPFVTAGDLRQFVDEHTLPSAKFHELASRLARIGPSSAPIASRVGGAGVALGFLALGAVILVSQSSKG